MYSITFDIPEFNGDAADTAKISVWSGSGSQANTGNALLLNAESGELEALGTAISSELASVTYTSTGSELTLDFNYNGQDVLAVFFGAESDGYPHPEINFDNIEISSIPEPSSTAYLALLAGAMVMSRNRKQ